MADHMARVPVVGRVMVMDMVREEPEEALNMGLDIVKVAAEDRQTALVKMDMFLSLGLPICGDTELVFSAAIHGLAGYPVKDFWTDNVISVSRGCWQGRGNSRASQAFGDGDGDGDGGGCGYLGNGCNPFGYGYGSDTASGSMCGDGDSCSSLNGGVSFGDHENGDGFGNGRNRDTILYE